MLNLWKYEQKYCDRFWTKLRSTSAFYIFCSSCSSWPFGISCLTLFNFLKLSPICVISIYCRINHYIHVEVHRLFKRMGSFYGGKINTDITSRLQRFLRFSNSLKVIGILVDVSTNAYMLEKMRWALIRVDEYNLTIIGSHQRYRCFKI